MYLMKNKIKKNVFKTYNLICILNNDKIHFFFVTLIIIIYLQDTFYTERNKMVLRDMKKKYKYRDWKLGILK